MSAAKKSSPSLLRKSGIAAIGDIPWGTHFCQFYQTPQDLIDILVPFFKAGLKNNEFCMWVTSQPLEADKAASAIKKALPGFERFRKNGQIEIIPYSLWYTKYGKFDSKRVLRGWVKKLEQARKRGFDGLRLSGNTFWLEKKQWKSFAKYEHSVDSVIGNYNMLAICTYSLEKCGASEIMDVISNHEFALVKRGGKWERIKNDANAQSKTALKESQDKLRVSEERLRFAQHVAGVGVWDWDISTGKLIWSKELFQLFGQDYRKKGASFHNWRNALHPGDRKTADEQIRKAIKDRVALFNEYRIVKPSGEVRWINAMGNTTYDVNGKPLRMSGVCIDVTERKKSEIRTRHLASFPEHNLNPVIELDDDGKIIFANFATYKTLKELKIQGEIEALFPENLDSILETLRQDKQNSVVREVNVRGRIFSESITLIPELKVVRIYAMDITSLKASDNALRWNERRSVLLSQSAAMLLATDEPQMMLDTIAGKAMEFLQCQVFFNYLLIPEKRKLRLNAYWGIPIKEAKRIESLDFGVAVCGCVAREGKRIVVDHILERKDKRTELVASYGVRAYCCHPLTTGNEVIGTLSFGTTTRDSFNAEEISVMKSVSDLVSLAMQRKISEDNQIRVHLKTRNILESITEAYIVFDPRGRFLELNKSAEHFLGKRSGQVKGKKFWDVFPRMREKEFYRNFRSALIENRPAHFEAFSKIAERWFEAHAYPSDEGLVVYLHDITDRKRSEAMLSETRDYLENLINYANAPIIVWDPEFKIVRFNHAFEFLSGYTSDEVMNKDLDMLFPQETKLESLVKIERTLKGEHWQSVEIPIICRDGSIRILLWNSANIYNEDKSLRTTIAQGQDITDRKEVEEALQKTRDELEERVQQRTADLIRAQKQLADAKRLSDIGALSATVAHELRNPLGVIRAAAFNLKRKNQDLELVKHLDRIDRKILDSDQIINNLLFYSRIKSPRFEEVNLYEILRESIAEAQIKFKGMGIKVKKSLKQLKYRSIEADPSQMREVFNNLLSNAFEAVAKDNGMIEVKAVCAGGDRGLKISIRDNGCGIEPDNMKRISEPFFTTKSRGTGLGLAVCFQIMRMHGGRIEVASVKDSGSTFTLVLAGKLEPERRS